MAPRLAFVLPFILAACNANPPPLASYAADQAALCARDPTVFRAQCDMVAELTPLLPHERAKREAELAKRRAAIGATLGPALLQSGVNAAAFSAAAAGNRALAQGLLPFVGP